MSGAMRINEARRRDAKDRIALGAEELERVCYESQTGNVRAQLQIVGYGRNCRTLVEGDQVLDSVRDGSMKDMVPFTVGVRVDDVVARDFAFSLRSIPEPSAKSDIARPTDLESLRGVTWEGNFRWSARCGEHVCRSAHERYLHH